MLGVLELTVCSHHARPVTARMHADRRRRVLRGEHGPRRVWRCGGAQRAAVVAWRTGGETARMRYAPGGASLAALSALAASLAEVREPTGALAEQDFMLFSHEVRGCWCCARAAADGVRAHSLVCSAHAHLGRFAVHRGRFAVGCPSRLLLSLPLLCASA